MNENLTLENHKIFQNTNKHWPYQPMLKNCFFKLSRPIQALTKAKVYLNEHTA